VSLSDGILVKKFLKGDNSSFEEIVKRYEKKIYNIAYRIMNNQEDASDVLQETFIQAFRKLSGFKGKSEFSTWLYRIAVNICLMKKRKGKQMKVVSLDAPLVTQKEDELRRELPEDWSKSPSATLDNKELKENINRAISMLPEDYRTTFILRDMNDVSTEDTAKILNISVPAVKSRLHRARLFLREELSKYFQEHV